LRRDGFTLVELLIVIAILGILVTLGFLGVRSYTAKAYNITAKHDLQNFVKAQEVSYYAAQTFIMVTTKVIPAVALIVVLYALHLIIITHRICGPLVNFSHAFRRVGEGDLRQRIKLRQGDYLKKECDRINDMIRDLSLMVAEAKEIQGRLAGDVARLADLAGKDKTGEGLSHGMALLEADVREMGQTLSRFKTGDEGEEGP